MFKVKWKVENETEGQIKSRKYAEEAFLLMCFFSLFITIGLPLVFVSFQSGVFDLGPTLLMFFLFLGIGLMGIIVGNGSFERNYQTYMMSELLKKIKGKK